MDRGRPAPRLRLPALWSLVTFTGGIALGRLLSLVLDGLPHPLLLVYAVLEVLVATAGWLLIARSSADGQPG